MAAAIRGSFGRSQDVSELVFGNGKVTYAQAVATRGTNVWCDNCGASLNEFASRLVSPKDTLQIQNVGGITTLSDYEGTVLHRCH